MADGESQRRRRRRPSSECEAPEKKREKAVGGGQERCGREFFDRPCEELAVALLGCELVCRGESGEECRGEVVETEAYLGGEDKAAHSYKGRRTAANEAMFMVSESRRGRERARERQREREKERKGVLASDFQPPGTAYVYTIYGVHHCFNISSRGPGAAVLVRALQPTGGQRVMQVRRGGRGERELCRGPGKLCQALAITKQWVMRERGGSV